MSDDISHPGLYTAHCTPLAALYDQEALPLAAAWSSALLTPLVPAGLTQLAVQTMRALIEHQFEHWQELHAVTHVKVHLEPSSTPFKLRATFGAMDAPQDEVLLPGQALSTLTAQNPAVRLAVMSFLAQWMAEGTHQFRHALLQRTAAHLISEHQRSAHVS